MISAFQRQKPDLCALQFTACGPLRGGWAVNCYLCAKSNPPVIFGWQVLFVGAVKCILAVSVVLAEGYDIGTWVIWESSDSESISVDVKHFFTPVVANSPYHPHTGLCLKNAMQLSWCNLGNNPCGCYTEKFRRNGGLFLGRDASHSCDGVRHIDVHSDKKKSACI